MKIRKSYVYYGTGKGKTCLTIGRGLRALGDNLQVVMIQFLEIRERQENEVLKNFEPHFRLFRFEKARQEEDLLNEDVKKEITSEVKHAFKFANKIVDTGECEMLILDGILDCVASGYLTIEDLSDMLDKKPQYMDLILTGESLPEGIADKVDSVYQIVDEK
ncbi:MAG: cob(I)yrinic acid a,c-diamide adenosyltransferase [Bacillota bacterium]